MSHSHNISDSISRIKNAIAVKKQSVTVKYSKLILALLELLQSQGYISEITNITSNDIQIILKYSKSNMISAISKIQVVSKPGKRVYCQARAIKSSNGGLGMTIISTSKGILPDYEARLNSLGGEVICKVF